MPRPRNVNPRVNRNKKVPGMSGVETCGKMKGATLD